MDLLRSKLLVGLPLLTKEATGDDRKWALRPRDGVSSYFRAKAGKLAQATKDTDDRKDLRPSILVCGRTRAVAQALTGG